MLLLILAGGAAGTAARYFLQQFIQHRAGTSFPVGTLLINISGSFLLGLVARYGAESASLPDHVRVALTVGFCGAFTTMSAFGYETVHLLNAHQYARAAFYMVVTLVGSVGGVLAGAAVAGRMF